MNLYLLTRLDKGASYDEFDSAVVAAESETEAKTIHPKNVWSGEGEPVIKVGITVESYDSWVPITLVGCKLIGTAVEGTETCVICASYNAG